MKVKRELIVDFSETYSDVSVDGGEVADWQDKRVMYHFNPKAITASDLIGRLSAKYQIRDLVVKEADIEVTIRNICEKRLLEV